MKLDINDQIKSEAKKEFDEIKNVFNSNNGKSIEELYDIISKRFYYNVFNFDGELFDIELDRIVVTILTDKNGQPYLSPYIEIDISEDCSGEWLDININKLQ